MIDECALPPLILASGSPRRRELLGNLGLDFRVLVRPIDEHIPPDAEPGAIVEQLSLQKGASLAEEYPGELVLSADTIVVLDDEILGKPADEAQARRMLARLSGREHTVYTGFALQYQGRRRAAHERTRVRFHSLSKTQIRLYAASGECLDKAGAYGIQHLGALLVEGVEGCYFNVMGLPLARLYRELLAFVQAEDPEAFTK